MKTIFLILIIVHGVFVFAQNHAIHKEICETEDGHIIYTGKPYGLNSYNLFTGIISKYTPINISKYDSILELDRPEKLFYDGKERLWVGTQKSGLWILSNDKFIHFNSKNGLFDKCSNFYEDSNQRIWCQSEGFSNTVAVYDEQNWQKFDLGVNVLGYQPVNFTNDNSGTVFIGTQKGLLKYKNKEFTMLSKENNYPFKHVSDCLMDRENNLWIGIQNVGIACYINCNDWNYYYKNENIPKNDIKIKPDNSGNIWFIGKNKIAVYNQLEKKFSNYIQHELESIISAEFDKKNNLWITTTGGGFTRFDGKEWISLESITMKLAMIHSFPFLKTTIDSVINNSSFYLTKTIQLFRRDNNQDSIAGFSEAASYYYYFGEKQPEELNEQEITAINILTSLLSRELALTYFNKEEDEELTAEEVMKYIHVLISHKGENRIIKDLNKNMIIYPAYYNSKKYNPVRKTDGNYFFRMFTKNITSDISIEEDYISDAFISSNHTLYLKYNSILLKVSDNE